MEQQQPPKWRRDMDKRKRDQKARFQSLEVGRRVLLRNVNEIRASDN